MQTVLLLAKLISSLLGTSFDDEWACWESLVLTDRYQYVCEYIANDDGGQPGRYAVVIGTTWTGATGMEVLPGPTHGIQFAPGRSLDYLGVAGFHG